MYNDSKILRSEAEEAFANILKVLVSSNYLDDHVLPNEVGFCSVTDPYAFVNSGTENMCGHADILRSHCAQLNLYTRDAFKRMVSLSL